MSDDHLKAAYQELCHSYRAIDDFRAKLLGFLPLATGTGIFLHRLEPLAEAGGSVGVTEGRGASGHRHPCR
jgi:hypothetical protein